MFMRFSAFCLFVFSLSSWAYTPTLEGMLQHGKETLAESALWEVSYSITRTDKEAAAACAENCGLYFKHIWHLGVGDKGQSLVVFYDDQSMKPESQFLFKFVPENKMWFLTKLEGDYLGSLFQPLMYSFFAHDSKPLLNSLKHMGFLIKSNREMVNPEKLALLMKYKTYLQQIKDNPEIKDTLPNPLKPEDAEELERVNGIMSSSYYQSPEALKLVKKGDAFFWEYQEDKLFLSFDNGEHQLQEIKFKHDDKEYQISFLDYELISGLKKMPRRFLIKFDSKEFELRFLGLRNFTYRPNRFMTIYDEYKDVPVVMEKWMQAETWFPSIF